MSDLPSPAEIAVIIRNAALQFASEQAANDEPAAHRIFAWQAGLMVAGMIHKGMPQAEALRNALAYEAAAIAEHRNIRAPLPAPEPTTCH